MKDIEKDENERKTEAEENHRRKRQNQPRVRRGIRQQ